MNFSVSMGICKKPSVNISEDVVGRSENVYWLLDGATPPMGELNHEHTIFYVNELNKALYKYSSEGNSTREILYESLKDVRGVFIREKLTDYEYLPCSTAIILKVNENYLEYSVLGDSTLGIQINDRQFVITDNKIKTFAVPERVIVRNLISEGLNEESLEYKNARKNLIAAEKRMQNIEGGYWIASIEPEAAHHAVNKKIKISPDDKIKIILASDGLVRLVSVFERYKDIFGIADEILLHGDTNTFNTLRKLEENTKNFKLQVSSTNDDASYIIITSD